MNKVTIYQRSGGGFCQNCAAAKRWLTKLGVKFDVEELTDEVQAEFNSDGAFKAQPIIVYGGSAHSGFQPATLEKIAADWHYFTGGTWGEVDD